MYLLHFYVGQNTNDTWRETIFYIIIIFFFWVSKPASYKQYNRAILLEKKRKLFPDLLLMISYDFKFGLIEQISLLRLQSAPGNPASSHNFF